MRLVLASLLLIAYAAMGSAQNASPIKDVNSLGEARQHAASLVRSGQFPAAIAAYQHILASMPHDEKAIIGLASAYRGIFNYDESRRLLGDAEKRYPRSALAPVELGKLDIHLQHYDEAVRELTRAVRREPNLSSAHEQLGVAYQAKGDDEQALIEFKKAVQLNPKSASAHYFRGSLYADRDDFERSYQDASEAHKLESNPQSDALLAKVAIHIGKCDEAIALLKPITESASSDPANLYLLSSAYKCAGQSELANSASAEFEARSRQAQETRTRTMEADHLAGEAGELARKNQLATALELTTRALEKDPENAATHALLAKIDFSRGDIATARQEIARALEKDPYNPDYLYVSGKVLEAQKDNEAALQAFQRTVLVNPNESDAYYEMAKIYQQQGKNRRAVEALRKAVQLSPDDPEYKKALAQANTRNSQ